MKCQEIFLQKCFLKHIPQTDFLFPCFHNAIEVHFMTIGGLSIILVLGIVNFVLVLFQLSTGLRWIKVPFGVHRKTGIAFFVIASVHGLLGLLAG